MGALVRALLPPPPERAARRPLGRARACRARRRSSSTRTTRPGGMRPSTSCWRAACSAGIECYAPIDAAMLEKYGFFARIGAFGVDLESRRGAAAFLRAGAASWPGPSARCGSRRRAASPTRASGRWACGPGSPGWRSWRPAPRSCRSRSSTPSGPSAVRRRWSAFGPPLHGARAAGAPARRHGWRGWRRRSSATMDRLAADAIARDPEPRSGRSWRARPASAGSTTAGGARRAMLRGRRFDPAHRSRRRDRGARLAGPGAGGAAGRARRSPTSPSCARRGQRPDAGHAWSRS